MTKRTKRDFIAETVIKYRSTGIVKCSTYNTLAITRRHLFRIIVLILAQWLLNGLVYIRIVCRAY